MTQTQRTFLRLVFDADFDERDAIETFDRGYRSRVWAELDDGSMYELTFYNVVRLSQVLDDDRRAGQPFFTEPGLIILPEVTLDNMEAAARSLAANGFFERYLARSSGPGAHR